MKGRTFVKDDKYIGKWVALESFNSDNVIDYGDDPGALYNELVSKGYNPLIIYCPHKDEIYI